MAPSARFGSPREKCYRHLHDARTKGWIAAFIASQAPNRVWGFLVTMPGGSQYWFAPKECLAFLEGLRIGKESGIHVRPARLPARR
jgi:hypothetical protein